MYEVSSHVHTGTTGVENHINYQHDALTFDHCKSVTICLHFKQYVYSFNIERKFSKNRKFDTYTHPQAIRDVDEFVSSCEQIWRNVALHHLLTNVSSTAGVGNVDPGGPLSCRV